ncbi:ArsR/SmtB family transcription factor [Aquibacillus halophilus]|uniref:ArsR/SmtB family transcription factor n=1 Tax=Aquibacillus halophilus TaxID=930132 RepID=UPI001F0EA5C6|nr:metalloregulator ArsR/SmtB family transcription factor [Aquibacillus halophilus]
MKDRCDVYCYDEDKVERVRTSIKDVDLELSVNVFKALADPNRLQIAIALTNEEEICVCDAANIINSTIATASHHLRYLKKVGLAEHRKEGKLVFYYLKDEDTKQSIMNAIIPKREDVSIV